MAFAEAAFDCPAGDAPLVSDFACTLDASDANGWARYEVLQPHYNLMHRQEYEGELQEVCVAEQMACLPYFSLAMGFLTGKYRPGSTVQSPRAGGASKYLDERGIRALAALDDMAAAHGTPVSAVALAKPRWIRIRKAGFSNNAPIEQSSHHMVRAADRKSVV